MAGIAIPEMAHTKNAGTPIKSTNASRGTIADTSTRMTRGTPATSMTADGSGFAPLVQEVQRWSSD
jgi:hypothetical protein